LSFKSFPLCEGRRAAAAAARGVSHRAGTVAAARIVQLENDYGAVTGERWEYDIDGKTVGFTIRNGKVERIDENR